MADTSPTEPAAPEPEVPEGDEAPADLWESSQPRENPLASTRVSQLWMATIVFAVILVLLLVFVLQNTRRVQISYFGWDFTMPLAVAMLLAAVTGILLAAIAGTLRILQLRRKVKKAQRA